MSTTSINILLVEDEAIWINELQIMLTELGFSVAATATTVIDAMAALRNTEYDIALIDIRLNGENGGLEIGQLLHNYYKKPFVFISGCADEHSLNEAVKANPSAYLSKPVTKASLFVTLQSAIANFNGGITATDITADTAVSFFFIKHGSGFKKIEWDNVLHLQSERNYTRLIIKNDKEGYLLRSSLQKTLNHIIPQHMRNSFVQINRAEAISIKTVEQLRGTDIFTHFGTFAIGDTYIEVVKKMLNIVV